MDIDRLTEQERYDMLAEMADLYYNEGKTQSEIARAYDTNRFRVAKLLQDARNEQIVEIKINKNNERNTVLEKELKQYLGLEQAVVVNTQYAPYIDSQIQLGKAGAEYLQHLLKPEMTIGITWGKTIYSMISQLEPVIHHPLTVVQLTGYLKMRNPAVDSRELVRAVAQAYSGEYYYLDLPLYINSEEVRDRICQEPFVRKTLEKTRQMDVILTGIGSKSSLPLENPQLQEYVTVEDKEHAGECIGSMYGYALDREGKVADLQLNKKVMAVPMEEIIKVPHRLAVACGRHKTECIIKTAKNQYYNELITDSDTAVHIVEQCR